MTAADFCLTSAGGYFLAGLVIGVWKYRCVIAAADARAPVYVDIAHRAALMYAFACALLAELCGHSAWPGAVNLVAAIVVVGFFAAAMLGYMVHAVLRDTDNQLRRPHRLGRGTIADAKLVAFMVALIVGEVGGFTIIFVGYLLRR